MLLFTRLHISKGLIGLAFAAAATSAYAEPEFMEVLAAKYPALESSPLADKSCGICHVSDSDFGFNAYGKQMAQKLTELNQKGLTEGVLAAIEVMDADNDGVSNGEELSAGKDPADGPAAAAEPTTQARKSSFPPKNGFHPAIVHFPIALLIAGLLLDLAGLVTKQKMLLFAGWYNLVLAAITSIGAVASGFLAMTLLKLPYKGLIFEHMLYGLGVSFLLWIMVALRVHRHESMNVPIRALYYLLAIASFLLVSWVGHLGGVFVYGE